MTTAEQDDIVRATWAIVAKDLVANGELLYTYLFTAYPDLKTTLYKNVSARVQSIRLMHMIDSSVQLISRPETRREEILKLGHRHYYYGVTAVHYPWVGEALYATLKTVLGDGYTPEVEKAWFDYYEAIYATMLEGADSQTKK
mmetsp:Transcript_6022/g.10626  ORF Transcript_6022/g.10626 Transcript_6022/m.10626 type:complete len:143 (-) Transcript_6022:262-690(-)